jgi:hypothetical protein
MAQVSMRSVFAHLSSLLARASRDRQLTRKEQLSVVLVGHIGILVGALVIEWKFNLGSQLPQEFIVCELAIIGVCIFLTGRLPWLKSYIEPATGRASNPSEGAVPEESVVSREKAPDTKVEKLAGVVLIGVSIGQFAALASLLWATGGPIESPFAEMTLAIAVFTPFLANEAKTVGFVVVASIVYYAVLILLYSNSHPAPETPQEFRVAFEAHDPSLWAYFCVNILILLGATAFTIFESVVRSWERSLPTTRGGAASPASGGDDGNGGPTDDAAQQAAKRTLEADPRGDGDGDGMSAEDPDPDEIRG